MNNPLAAVTFQPDFWNAHVAQIPPPRRSGMQGTCWDSARYCSQLVATWLVGEQEAFKFESETPWMYAVCKIFLSK